MGRRGTGYNLMWLLGLVAALFLAFGPAVAPVLSLSNKNSYIEICTSFGLVKKAVAGDFAASSQGQPEKNHGDKKSNHCLFCNLRKLTLILPQAPALPVPAGFFLSVPVPLVISLFKRLPVFSHSPRAPPFLLP